MKNSSSLREVGHSPIGGQFEPFFHKRAVFLANNTAKEGEFRERYFQRMQCFIDE